MVTMVGVVLGRTAQAENYLAEFVERCGCPAARRTLDAVPPGEGLKRAVAKLDSVVSEASDTAATFSKSEFFRRPLTREAIANLLRNLSEGQSSGESRELSFTPMGGSYNRVPPQATAFVYREEQFLVEHVATIVRDASDSAARTARSWTQRSWQCVHEHASGGVYPNFPDLDLPDWKTAYYGPNYERLRQIKSTYDPHGVFSGPQSI